MRAEIIETSLAQFQKYGIREMSIQKLIEPLAISTKTVYKYFENKEQLLEEALHLYHDQQFEVLKSLGTNKNSIQLFMEVWYMAVEREYRVSSIFFEDLQYYYPALKEKIEKAIAKKFTDQFILIIRAGVAENTFSKDVDPAIAVESIYVLLRGLTRDNRFAYLKQTPLRLLTHTIGTYVRCMCTAKGREALDLYLPILKPFGISERKRANGKLRNALIKTETQTLNLKP